MTRSVFLLFLLLLLFLTACGGNSPVVRVTIEPTQIGGGAPIYTATPSLTPSSTPTITPSFTPTDTPTVTNTPSDTPTASLTPTETYTPTASPTNTASPTATSELFTPTPINLQGAPASITVPLADFSNTTGWSCGDFPCAEDIDAFLQRIRVPQGFELSFVGRFDGQVQQITYGADGRLYATVLEDGGITGAVYVMEADGSTNRYSSHMVSPNGLAFQPGTDVLYVSARTTIESGGALYRVLSNGTSEVVLSDLPCCFQRVGNQPNGLTFGADGLLYMGIGAVTDHAESPNPDRQAMAELLPYEAAVLRINPHSKEIEAYANGIHNPFDLDFTTNGQLFVGDMGLVTGEGDRLLRVSEGENFGWPFYRRRGCVDCPPLSPDVDAVADFYSFLNYSLPHGLLVYKGRQFPSNMQNTLFVALWNGTEWGQRIVWIDPQDPRLGSEDYQLQPFVTGLIRPTDISLAPDGSIVVADFVYGHIWRVSYTGEAGFSVPRTEASSSGFSLTMTEASNPTANGATVEVTASGFVTPTPQQ
jgi:glucose/arabinose dehydrogenase